jgi:hypothetical protein
MMTRVCSLLVTKEKHIHQNSGRFSGQAASTVGEEQSSFNNAAVPFQGKTADINQDVIGCTVRSLEWLVTMQNKPLGSDVWR